MPVSSFRREGYALRGLSRSTAPRWITAKIGGDCSHCELPVRRGDAAFWFPTSHQLFCHHCGRRMADKEKKYVE